MSWRQAFIALGIIFCLAPLAHAQERLTAAEALNLLDQGRKHYNAGDYDRALPLFALVVQAAPGVWGRESSSYAVVLNDLAELYRTLDASAPASGMAGLFVSGFREFTRLRQQAGLGGAPLLEPYAHYQLPASGNAGGEDGDVRRKYGPVTVPAGHYFMMGDNRDDSQDSRYWGFLPATFVKGRALFIYWSFGGPGGTRWGRLLHQIH